ncbi:glycoside hydrolase superfamily [Sphaerosporella brunnea]|uniref:chitinase n=1 Tax=Sphaerosporella brunnea TaxID=1250544 RepID=A0A5J5EIQ6_9PEZI|nr:glycoside hydrolase superfamily [Sphaerosporella brunnea]
MSVTTRAGQRCEHVINFAFALVDPTTFEVAPMNDGDKALYKRMVALKRMNPGLEIWIAIGGWSFNDENQHTKTTFSYLAGSNANQKKFFASLTSFMATYGFDGVDMDWEYPAARDRTSRDEDFENFPRLWRTSEMLWETLVELPGSFLYLQQFDLKAFGKHVDYFNVMSYEFHGTWDEESKSVEPLILAHTNLTEIKDALDLLWRNDVDPQQVTLGMAYYGRSFTAESSSCTDTGCRSISGGRAGECSSTVGVLTNPEISRIIEKNGLTPKLDKAAAVKTITWDKDQWVSFDDYDTFKLKADWARGVRLGGVMVWAISQDDIAGTSAKNLARAIDRKIEKIISLPAFALSLAKFVDEPKGRNPFSHSKRTLELRENNFMYQLSILLVVVSTTPGLDDMYIAEYNNTIVIDLDLPFSELQQHLLSVLESGNTSAPEDILASILCQGTRAREGVDSLRNTTTEVWYTPDEARRLFEHSNSSKKRIRRSFEEDLGRTSRDDRDERATTGMWLYDIRNAPELRGYNEEDILLVFHLICLSIEFVGYDPQYNQSTYYPQIYTFHVFQGHQVYLSSSAPYTYRVDGWDQSGEGSVSERTTILRCPDLNQDGQRTFEFWYPGLEGPYQDTIVTARGHFIVPINYNGQNGPLFGPLSPHGLRAPSDDMSGEEWPRSN